MNVLLIYSFIFIILFHIVFTQNVQFDFYTFDEAVKNINDVPFNKNDYDVMISNIITLLNNYYIYLDIAKNPPPPFKPVDVIEELKSIKTEKINYYEFYQKVYTILLKLQDSHLQIFFKKILEFLYISPIYYYTKTINNTNYLFCNLINSPERFFNTSLIKEINENLKYPIKSINDKDPFDFVQTFGRYQKFKSEHAQFTFNIYRFIFNGKFHTYPFIKEDLTNIKIEFNNGNKINFDYKILKPKIISRQLEEFYEKEMKKYSPDDILKPTIIEIEQKFIEQNNKTRKLQQSFWDINYQGKIKLKVDHKNKVNVIYQNSFNYFNNIKNSNFEENIIFQRTILNQKINQNNYPIIIIIDFSSGDYTNFEQIFMLIKAINPSLSLDTLNIAYKNKNDNFTFLIDIDDYGKGIKHKRTKIEREDYKLKIWGMSEKLNLFRKPNEIIVFTDGFAIYGNSLFIKNLQESGNAIIVGYNGNPSEKKKNDKFDASQSPSVIRSFPNDTNVIKLSKYGIIVNGITYGETFNDSYVNKNVTPIPREYIINPIDERSNIYDEYSDNRYNEFINEAKRIFKKYENECNIDNKNMVFLNDSCKFDDKKENRRI